MAPKKDPKAPAKKAEPAAAPAPAPAPEPAPAPAAAPAVDLSAVKVQSRESMVWSAVGRDLVRMMAAQEDSGFGFCVQMCVRELDFLLERSGAAKGVGVLMELWKNFLSFDEMSICGKHNYCGHRPDFIYSAVKAWLSLFTSKKYMMVERRSAQNFHFSMTLQ